MTPEMIFPVTLTISTVKQLLPKYLKKYAEDVAHYAKAQYIGPASEAYIVEGPMPATVSGSPAYHTTPAGTLVRYPKSYGWRTVYHHSTSRLEVGTSRLLAMAVDMYRAEVDRAV